MGVAIRPVKIARKNVNRYLYSPIMEGTNLSSTNLSLKVWQQPPRCICIVFICNVKKQLRVDAIIEKYIRNQIAIFRSLYTRAIFFFFFLVANKRDAKKVNSPNHKWCEFPTVICHSCPVE